MIYPVDRAIHRLNNWGLEVNTKNEIFQNLPTEDHLFHKQLSRDVMVTVSVNRETPAILMKKPPFGEPINMQIFLFPQIIKMAADNVNKIFNTAAGHEETTLNFWRVIIIQTIARYL